MGYGACPVCGEYLQPIWYVEHEEVVENGIRYETGRMKDAVSHLECDRCGHKELVDDTFDGQWHY